MFSLMFSDDSFMHKNPIKREKKKLVCSSEREDFI